MGVCTLRLGASASSTTVKGTDCYEEAIPCVLKIVHGCIFNKHNPIVVGVEITQGIAKVGMQLCKEGIDIGRIAAIELNHAEVDVAHSGQNVVMKIDDAEIYGCHFDCNDPLVSCTTLRARASASMTV